MIQISVLPLPRTCPRTLEDLAALLNANFGNNSVVGANQVDLGRFAVVAANKAGGVPGFLKTTLPFMFEAAESVNTLFPDRCVPMLCKQSVSAVTLSPQKICALLAASSLGVLTAAPAQFFRPRLFMGRLMWGLASSMLNYFAYHAKHRNDPEMRTREVVFSRVVLPKEHIIDWSTSAAVLCTLEIHPRSYIEDFDGLLVDFANKWIGGGVCGGALAQEEVMFQNCPELIVSTLFCDEMDDNEAIRMTGFRRYTTFWRDSTGKPGQPFTESAEKSAGRQCVAIDAQPMFGGSMMQWTNPSLRRELTKAYCGFQGDRAQNLVTGHWGCGAFGGHKQLKAITQWLAASQVGRQRMVFVSYDDPDFAARFQTFSEAAVRAGASVGGLHKALSQSIAEVYSGAESPGDLFSVVLRHLGASR